MALMTSEQRPLVPGPVFDRLISHGRLFTISVVLVAFVLAGLLVLGLEHWLFGPGLWTVIAGNVITYMAGTTGRWATAFGKRPAIYFGLVAEKQQSKSD